MAKSIGVRQEARGGFTLVELLVVITIIGILMGLLIPAVQAARETARRNQCSTQINNLAKAAIQYEMSHKSFPGWVNDVGYYTPPASGLPVDPSDPEDLTASATAHKKLGSWVVKLLPSLDAQPVYEVWTQDKYPLVTTKNSLTNFTVNAAPNLAILQCPSSPSIDATSGKNSYIANCGMYNLTTALNSSSPQIVQRSKSNTVAGGGTMEDITFAMSMEKSNGVFNQKYGKNTSSAAVGPDLRVEDMKDGSGNTVLFSENLQAISWNQLHPSETTSRTLLAPATGSTDVAYPQFSRVTQGFVWHYRDAKGIAMPFNGSKTVDNTTPFPVPEINGPFNGQDIFITRMDTAGSDAHLLARPSSAHNDGVNMGFADGSSRFVVQTIDYRVYQAIMTPRGKSSYVPLREFVIPGDAL